MLQAVEGEGRQAGWGGLLVVGPAVGLQGAKGDWGRYRRYIAQNPVKVGLAERAGEYPYCYDYLAEKERRG